MPDINVNIRTAKGREKKKHPETLKNAHLLTKCKFMFSFCAKERMLIIPNI